MSAIKQLIKEINTLRPLPQVASQILAIVEDPTSSISDVAEIVLYDVSITA